MNEEKSKDEDIKIKAKLKEMQTHIPLLQELLKSMINGEKNDIVKHKKIKMMIEIITGKISCTKLVTLMRIEEVILKIKETKQTKMIPEMEQTLKDSKSSKENALEVINLDSSDDEDVEIVSYTAPEPRRIISGTEDEKPSTCVVLTEFKKEELTSPFKIQKLKEDEIRTTVNKVVALDINKNNESVPDLTEEAEKREASLCMTSKNQISSGLQSKIKINLMPKESLGSVIRKTYDYENKETISPSVSISNKSGSDFESDKKLINEKEVSATTTNDNQDSPPEHDVLKSIDLPKKEIENNMKNIQDLDHLDKVDIYFNDDLYNSQAENNEEIVNSTSELTVFTVSKDCEKISVEVPSGCKECEPQLNERSLQTSPISSQCSLSPISSPEISRFSKDQKENKDDETTSLLSQDTIDSSQDNSVLCLNNVETEELFKKKIKNLLKSSKSRIPNRHLSNRQSSTRCNAPRLKHSKKRSYSTSSTQRSQSKISSRSSSREHSLDGTRIKDEKFKNYMQPLKLASLKQGPISSLQDRIINAGLLSERCTSLKQTDQISCTVEVPQNSMESESCAQPLSSMNNSNEKRELLSEKASISSTGAKSTARISPSKKNSEKDNAQFPPVVVSNPEKVSVVKSEQNQIEFPSTINIPADLVVEAAEQIEKPLLEKRIERLKSEKQVLDSKEGNKVLCSIDVQKISEQNKSFFQKFLIASANENSPKTIQIKVKPSSETKVANTAHQLKLRAEPDRLKIRKNRRNTIHVGTVLEAKTAKKKSTVESVTRKTLVGKTIQTKNETASEAETMKNKDAVEAANKALRPKTSEIKKVNHKTKELEFETASRKAELELSPIKFSQNTSEGEKGSPTVSDIDDIKIATRKRTRLILESSSSSESEGENYHSGGKIDEIKKVRKGLFTSSSSGSETDSEKLPKVSIPKRRKTTPENSKLKYNRRKSTVPTDGTTSRQYKISPREIRALNKDLDDSFIGDAVRKITRRKRRSVHSLKDLTAKKIAENFQNCKSEEEEIWEKITEEDYDTDTFEEHINRKKKEEEINKIIKNTPIVLISKLDPKSIQAAEADNLAETATTSKLKVDQHLDPCVDQSFEERGKKEKLSGDLSLNQISGISTGLRLENSALPKITTHADNVRTVIHNWKPKDSNFSNENESENKNDDIEEMLRILTCTPPATPNPSDSFRLTDQHNATQDLNSSAAANFESPKVIEESNRKDLTLDQLNKPNLPTECQLKGETEVNNKNNLIGSFTVEDREMSPDVEIKENLIPVIEILDDEDELKSDSLKTERNENCAQLRVENCGYQKIQNSEYIFHCLIEKCNFGATISFEDLQDHVKKEHDVMWSGKCKICKNKLTTLLGKQPIEEELNHMISVHIKELYDSQSTDGNHVINLLKPWLSETKSHKNKIFCESMVSQALLPLLYKCMGDDCRFISDSKIEMSKHLATHELKTIGKADNPRPWLECCYCEHYAAKTLQILEHVDCGHSSSIFQCSRCFYRSCSRVNVKNHQNQYHPSNDGKNTILECIGSLRSIIDDFKRIQKLKEDNIKAVSCSVCTQKYIRKDLMIEHFKMVHKESEVPKNLQMGLFSCIFCDFEDDLIKEMCCHMANKHPEELLLIGVRGIKENSVNQGDISSIAAPEITEPERNNISSNAGLAEIKQQSEINDVQKFKNNLMNLQELQKLFNPRSTYNDSCKKEDSRTNKRALTELSTKMVELLTYFIKSEMLHPCCICSKEINLENQWTDHFNTEHPTTSRDAVWQCPQCPKMNSFWTYPLHFINHHSDQHQIYFCYYCASHFYTDSEANKHLMTHTGKEEDSKICTFELSQESAGDNKFNEIGIVLPQTNNSSVVDVIKHMIEISKKRKEKESKPKNFIDIRIDLNKNIYDMNYPAYIPKKQRYVCSSCNNIWIDEKTFENHFKTAHKNILAFKCPHCNLLINPSSYEVVRDHLRLHFQKIIYKCCFCSIYTDSIKLLIKHIKNYKHQNVPIACFTRDDKIVNSAYQIIHFAPLSNRSSDKNIQCVFCSTCVDTYKNLDMHLSNVHKLSRIYKCYYCTYQGDIKNVNSHIKEIHMKCDPKKFRFISTTVFLTIENQEGNCLQILDAQNIESTNKASCSNIIITAQDVSRKRKHSDISDRPISDQNVEVKKRLKSQDLEADKLITIENQEGNCSQIPDAQKIESPNIESCSEIVIAAQDESRDRKYIDISDCPTSDQNVEVKKRLKSQDFEVDKLITIKNQEGNCSQILDAQIIESTNTASCSEIVIAAQDVSRERKYSDISDWPTSDQNVEVKQRLKSQDLEVDKLENSDSIVKDGTGTGTGSENYFECYLCAFKFTNYEDYRSHIKTHSEFYRNSAYRNSVYTSAHSVQNHTITTLPVIQATPIPSSSNRAPTYPSNILLERLQQAPQDQIRLVPMTKLMKHTLPTQSNASTPSTYAESKKLPPPARKIVESFTYACFHCSTEFNSYKNLCNHWNFSTCPAKDNKSYRFRIARGEENFIVRQVLNKIIQHTTGTKSQYYQCWDCGSSFFNENFYINHMTSKYLPPIYHYIEQEDIFYGCDECSIFYNSEEQAIQHIARHTFRYSCIYCSVAYRTLEEVHLHYLHTHKKNEKLYKYDVTSFTNMEIYQRMLIVFPCGLVLTKDHLRHTCWGNVHRFTKLIDKSIKEDTHVPILCNFYGRN